MHRPPPIFHNPLSTFHHPLSTIRRPQSTVHRPPSTFHRRPLLHAYRPPPGATFVTCRHREPLRRGRRRPLRLSSAEARPTIHRRRASLRPAATESCVPTPRASVGARHLAPVARWAGDSQTPGGPAHPSGRSPSQGQGRTRPRRPWREVPWGSRHDRAITASKRSQLGHRRQRTRLSAAFIECTRRATLSGGL